MNPTLAPNPDPNDMRAMFAAGWSAIEVPTWNRKRGSDGRPVVIFVWFRTNAARSS